MTTFLTGIAGRYPNSANLCEFWTNLCVGKDLVTSSVPRWPMGYHGLPSRLGQITQINKYDNMFFGVGKPQAAALDPQIRMLLEVVYECITDAGYSMTDLAGSNTGVYIGGCFSDLHKVMLQDMMAGDGSGISGYENTGCCFTMFSNRISYHFDFTGPSLSIDTACSSSLVALDQAVRDLRSGRITRAIVGGVSLCTDPTVSKAFQQYSMLSPTGTCYAFDDRANGYVRADGIGAVLLELAESSGGPSGVTCGLMEILGTGTNSDGFKPQGITFPSATRQAELFSSVFSANHLDVGAVRYIEAHGTGTVAGDGVELSSIDAVFCPQENLCNSDGATSASAGTDTTAALLVGSVKSNMGHAEGASGMMAVSKVAGILTSGKIPGNLHYQSSKNHSQLQTGKIVVVDRLQTVDFSADSQKGLVVINNFGFGGTNAVLVGKAGGASLNTAVTTTRYIFGRTKAALEGFVNSNALNGAAWSKQMRASSMITKFPWRGVVTVPTTTADDTGDSSAPAAATAVMSSVSLSSVVGGALGHVPVAFCYSGQGCQWNGMGKQLYRHNTLFRQTIDDACVGLPLHSRYTDSVGFNAASSDAASSTNVAVSSISDLFECGEFWMDPCWSGLGITLVQIGLTAVLKDAGVVPDYIFGHSVGEVACGYADGCTSAREAARIAYVRCDCAINASGLMLAAGLSYADAIDMISDFNYQDTVSVACNNSPDGVTLSGSSAEILAMKALLESKSIFAKVVPTGGIAYHSLFFKQNSVKIEAILAEAIEQNRREEAAEMLQKSQKTTQQQSRDQPICRSSQWLSTSSHASMTPYADAMYHMGNCTGMVDFAPVVASLPVGTIVVEVGPHGLLKSIIKRCHPDITSISCMTRLDKEALAVDSSGDGSNSLELKNLQQCLDSLWLSGASFEFPKRNYIVPMENRVPMIWDHEVDWRVAEYTDFEMSTHTGIPVSYDLLGKDAYLLDHRIDGKAIFPATGHAFTAWRALSGNGSNSNSDNNGVTEDSSMTGGVCIQDMKIHSAVIIQIGNDSDSGADRSGLLIFTVQFKSIDFTAAGIDKGLQSFTVIHQETVVASGSICLGATADTNPMTGYSCLGELMAAAYSESLQNTTCAAGIVGDSGAGDININANTQVVCITGSNIYSQLHRYGYEYGAQFRLMQSKSILLLDNDGPSTGFALDDAASTAVSQVMFQPTQHWIAFLDNLLQAYIGSPNALSLPTEIGEIHITGAAISDATVDCTELLANHPVYVCPDIGAVGCRQVVIRKLKTATMSKSSGKPVSIQSKDEDLLERLHSGRTSTGRDEGNNGAICVNSMAFVRYGCRIVPAAVETLLNNNSECNGDRDEYLRHCLHLISEVLRDNLPGSYTVLEMTGTVSAQIETSIKEHLEYQHQFQQQQWGLSNIQSVDWATRTDTPAITSMTVPLTPPNADTTATGVMELGQVSGSESDSDDDTDSAADVDSLDASSCETIGAMLRARLTPLLYTFMHSKLDQCLSANLEHRDHVAADGCETAAVETSSAIVKADLYIVDGASFMALGFSAVTMWHWIYHYLFKTTGGFLLLHNTDSCAREALVQCGFEIVLEYASAAKQPTEHTDSTAAVAATPVLLLLAYKAANGSSVIPSLLTANVSSDPATAVIITSRHDVAMNSPQLLVTTDFGYYGFTRSLRQEPPSDAYTGLRVCILPDADSDISGGGCDSADVCSVYTSLEYKSALPMHGYQYQQPQNGSEGGYILGGYHQLLPSARICNDTVTAIFKSSISGKNSPGHHLEVSVPGDLTSIHWVPNAHSAAIAATTTVTAPTSGSHKYVVEYCGINFKDAMLAYGKLKHDINSGGDSGSGGGIKLGLEFSGYCQTNHDQRVFGVSASGCMATCMYTPEHLTWPLPANMSSEQACTLPVVYSTAYCALVVKASIQRGQIVLIHSIAGGVGQAALNLCRFRGCTVIATCSDDKREWVHTALGLPLSHILNSHSTSFRDKVMLLTRGRGVDIVLNSLSDVKLQASLDCVAKYGHFCEIGKYDIQQNSAIGLGVFDRNISFHAFDLAEIMFNSHGFGRSANENTIAADGVCVKDAVGKVTQPPLHGATAIWRQIHTLVAAGLSSGEVKPLSTTVFNAIEPALKCIAGGKHKGKVLVRVCNDPESSEGSGGSDSGGGGGDNDESSCHVDSSSKSSFAEYENNLMRTSELPLHPQFTTRGVHMVVGGLGGFGLELIDWLFSHGAEAVIIVSRGDPKPHQLYRLHGCRRRTFIYHSDLGDLTACTDLCSEHGASLVGIWHLGMVLNDRLYSNMTEQAWNETVRVKATIAANLDTASRLHNPNLEHFVMWSSVSSLFGNPGQTNYAYANACMESVCMRRQQEGYCGVAIQWGLIGNVGVLSGEQLASSVNKALAFAPQHIDSCLNASLAYILSSKLTGVVTSYVPKNPVSGHNNSTDVSSWSGSGGFKTKKSLGARLARALGEDLSRIRPTDTLTSLGMDSLQSVEINNILRQVVLVNQNRSNSGGGGGSSDEIIDLNRKEKRNGGNTTLCVNDLRHTPWGELSLLEME